MQDSVKKIRQIIEEKYEFLKDTELVLDDIKDSIDAEEISWEEVKSYFSNFKKIQKNKDTIKTKLEPILKKELIITIGIFQLRYTNILKKRDDNQESLIPDILWKSMKKIVTLLIGLAILRNE